MMNAWPELHFSSWQHTAEALHLYTQVIGKYRLAHTPWVNHSWHATLYPTARGLTTGPVPDPSGAIVLRFDFVEHAVIGEAANGERRSFPLRMMSVAEFYKLTKDLITELGGTPKIHGRPNELLDPLPFAQDTAERPYDGDAVRRYHQILLKVASVFETFRTGYLGKVSPVHLFWGSFDLAVTRFSGKAAPAHPGGIPHLPDDITREAYSHEVSSAGFWPGGGGAEDAGFYCYAYPAPENFGKASIEPTQARWHADLGEFILPYEAVRTADRPDETLLAFLQSTYSAAADLGGWDRDNLECVIGQPGVVRPVSFSK